ncbi:cell surface glycoprotein MUC18-like isoform X2 [Biomphalaria glabrata]|uniref:Cell surface glycoprotein MUC18-like isoform X2 n=1 Tax=Biomphalaria glabrata TaxID=6526 RepID=A0A9W2YXT4_BIOGL|nr:cell surface glycoprotein MUC18-like isoform X2 [Biomphalaria glabrata]
MPGLFKWFLIFVVATCCLCVHSIDVSTSWLTDTIIGTNATLQCGWTAATGETPATLFLSPNNNSNANYFTCEIYSVPPHACTKDPSALEKYSIATSLRGSVSMLITKLSCTDDGTQYYCIVSNNSKPPAISNSVLRVKVPPTVPTLSNVQTGVKENSSITATCTAGVGYPKAGQIVWKAYRNGQSVNLPPEIVITSMNASQPEDDKCTVRTQSSVTLKANRLHQNISLACFVTNQDFKPTAPDTCTDTKSDLCAQTEPAVVTYPVSKMNLKREPASTLYEGARVTLKCQAEGNPLPTYSWTKIGDENRKLFVVMDGLVSTITLTSLNKSLDAGDYSCKALNIVENEKYIFLGFISLIIDENITQTSTTIQKTPTTVTTVTKTPTGTGSPEATTVISESGSNTVSMIVMGVILSAIIIVQFVVIIYLLLRVKGKYLKENKATKKEPRVYDRTVTDPHYIYIDDIHSYTTAS